MIEAIISGISAKIYETFGEGYEIYSDRVAQNLNEPCFLISPLNHSQKSKLSNSTYKRWYRQYPFCIFFFPERVGDQYTINQAVAEKLYECLEYIETDIGLLRGTGMRYSIEDKDLLNFVVSYNIFVHKDDREKTPNMQTVKEHVNVSEGVS